MFSARVNRVVHRLFRYLRGFVPVLNMTGVAWVAVTLISPSAVHADAFASELRYLLEREPDFVTRYGLDREGLSRFYADIDYQPAWLEAKSPSVLASRLRAHLEQADQQGLSARDYHTHLLGLYWEALAPESVVRRDLLLTDAALRYMRHLRDGHVRIRQSDPNWYIQENRDDIVDDFIVAWRSQAIPQSLERVMPRHVAYRQLQRALARYREIEAHGGWPQLVFHGLVREGDAHAVVPQLRQRLALEGYQTSEGLGDIRVLDSVLSATVRHFQWRHGLKEDGVLGPDTLRALNVPVEDRIQQIRLNMERWRWMPRELGERYILVNMGGYLLTAVNHGENHLDMRVIIGKPYRSTPAFIGDMTHLVFNPYWNVPPKIAGLDLLPQQQANSEFFAAKGIRVFDNWQADSPELIPDSVDWSRINGERFPYKLRQDPGAGNSLGRVKFMLPNPFDIYLHDTPAQHLFARPVRTFSSGCIRVEKPLELAEFVLEDPRSPVDSAEVVQQLVDGGPDMLVMLPAPLPVYLVYWTAWVGEEGSVHFRPDVYGRDARMAQVMGGGSG